MPIPPKPKAKPAPKTAKVVVDDEVAVDPVIVDEVAVVADSVAEIATPDAEQPIVEKAPPQPSKDPVPASNPTSVSLFNDQFFGGVVC